MNPFRRQPPYVYVQPQPSLRRQVAGFAGRLAGRAAVGTVRAGVRHRAKIWPTLGTLGMGGVAAWLGMADDGWKTAIVLSVVAGAVLGWSQWRAWKVGEEWLTRSIVVAWATWAVASTWTVAATANGVFTPPVPGLGVIALLGAQAWWFVHQQLRKELVVAEDSVEERGEELHRERVKLWVQMIACPGGALPNSQLLGILDLPERRGWEALIQLPAGDAQNTESAVAATRRIAKVYRVPASQVVVEPPLDGMEDIARLLVLTSNPLRAVQIFDGPTLNHATGQFRFGVHADGEAALWRLWTPESGVCHGMVAGTTGAGKSGLLKVLCAEIRHSGNSVLMLADPEGGESSPDWAEGAHCFAGTVPRIRRMLQAAERIMKARRKRRSRRRWIDEHGRTRRGAGYFVPTPDEPAIYIVIDEAPDVLADPECARIIASLGKKGRKHGIACIIFVQVPSLSELGGDLTVRSMLSSTNIVIFRTSDSLSATMGAPMKLPVDPVTLPAEWPDGTTTAGLGFLAKVGGRVGALRAAYQEDAYHWATTGDPVPWADEDLAAAADERGNYLTEWRDLLDLDDDEEEEELAQAAANPGGYVVQVPEGTGQKILSFLLDRRVPVRLSVIAKHANVSSPAASNALKRLEAAGKVERAARRGMWAITAQAVAIADELEKLVNA